MFAYLRHLFFLVLYHIFGLLLIPLRSLLRNWFHNTIIVTNHYQDDYFVIVVPVLVDNYTYIIVDNKTKQAAVVDPVDAGVILELAQDWQITLTTVLTTHHHWDHSGGNFELWWRSPQKLNIMGSDLDKHRIPYITHPLTHQQQFQVGQLKVTALLSPCHTRGHMMYFVESNNSAVSPPSLFTGDTIFLSGCGRFFEGNSREMLAAVNMLRTLPQQTAMYCGHEYSLKNLLFSLDVDKGNVLLFEKLKWARAQRKQKLPTVPSTLAEEFRYNPFLRTNQPNIVKSVTRHFSSSLTSTASTSPTHSRQHNNHNKLTYSTHNNKKQHEVRVVSDDVSVSVLAQLRKWKDKWKVDKSE